MINVTYLRSFRIAGGIALFDLIVSYIGIYILAPLLSRMFIIFKIKTTRSQWLWLTVPIGTMFHIIFNQNSSLSKMLFDTNGNYIVKFIFVVMLYMGLKDLRTK